MKRLALIAAMVLATSSWAAETAPVVLTSSGSSVSQAFNIAQKVLITCDADAYFLWGTSTVTVSSANGVPLVAGEKIDSQAGSQARYLAVISASGTANCKVFPVWGVK